MWTEGRLPGEVVRMVAGNGFMPIGRKYKSRVGAGRVETSFKQELEGMKGDQR